MSGTLTRLILCLGVIIGMVPIYVVVVMAVANQASGDYDTPFLVAGAVTGLCFMASWNMVWRTQVKWTNARIGLTTMLLPASLLLAVVAYGVVVAIESHATEVGIVLGTIAWAAGWLIGTALIWRETKPERAARLRAHGVHALPCPQCGYNLTGLTQTQCPECGTKFTLDQLVADALDQRAEASV